MSATKTIRFMQKLAILNRTIPFLLMMTVILSCDEDISQIEFGEFNAGPILFIADTNGTSQLFSMELDGSNIKQLTENTEYQIFDAQWSPNGKFIAFESSQYYVPYYGNSIYLMRSNGTSVQRITQKESSSYFATGYKPVWSKDSKKIAYSKLLITEALGIYEVFLYNLEDRMEQRVTYSNLSQKALEWLVDNETIIINTDQVSFDSTGKQIRHTTVDFITIQGNYLQTFGRINQEWNSPRLSHNGSLLALVIRDEQIISNIYFMNLFDYSLTKVTNGEHAQYSCIGWSNDDKSILILAFDGLTDEYGRPITRTYFISLTGEYLREITPFKKKYHKITSVFY